MHHFVAILELQTTEKRKIRIKIGDFWSRVTLKFDKLHSKAIGCLFFAILSFVHNFVAICEFKPEMPKLGQNLFWPLWPGRAFTLTFCKDVTFVKGD